VRGFGYRLRLGCRLRFGYWRGLRLRLRGGAVHFGFEGFEGGSYLGGFVRRHAGEIHLEVAAQVVFCGRLVVHLERHFGQRVQHSRVRAEFEGGFEARAGLFESPSSG
jgi:hypothetical protein